MREFDFYIVPTPIGNLGDITIRAIEVLKTVDVIACEDSRNTQKLLNHYSIGTKCISYHKFNERERVSKFIELINQGKKIALVSDAGTPLFCDPGSVLVKELKKNGKTVTALSGANAVVTFLSQIPRESEDFVFVGFLPRIKSQITELITKYNDTDIVFYESPKRLIETLNIIKQEFPQKQVSVGRELTKVFEEVITDTAKTLFEHFSKEEVKGEIVVMIHRSSLKCGVDTYADKIKLLKSKNFSDKDVSIILSELYDVSKNEVYSYLVNSK